jgi:hypothetical protein
MRLAVNGAAKLAIQLYRIARNATANCGNQTLYVALITETVAQCVVPVVERHCKFGNANSGETKPKEKTDYEHRQKQRKGQRDGRRRASTD